MSFTRLPFTLGVPAAWNPLGRGAGWSPEPVCMMCRRGTSLTSVQEIEDKFYGHAAHKQVTIPTEPFRLKYDGARNAGSAFCFEMWSSGGHFVALWVCTDSTEELVASGFKTKTKLRGHNPQANYTDRPSERPPLVGEVSANICR
jgi:hypothetical protein